MHSIFSDLNYIQQLALTHFQLTCTAKLLPGEVDLNYYLKTTDDQQFLLKIAPPNTPNAQQNIEFEQAILAHLNAKELPFQTPHSILSKNNEKYIFLKENNSYLRLQTWVAGRMLDTANPRTNNLLKNWGETCGYLSHALQDFDHPAAHRSYKWNPSETLQMRQYAPYFKTETERKIADHFWNLFAATDLSGLRKSVNYNDAHEHNLLINKELINPKISGVIDFGDALYTETINELAIACAYAGMKMRDPLAAMQQVVQGYHSIFLIEEKELAVLFPLIGARLMITAANAAYQQHQNPENEYLQISAQPAWNLLQQLHQLHPDFVHYSFREVCGFEPCAQRAVFDNFIKESTTEWYPLVDFKNQQTLPLDL
ncbi:MAG: phosphotransferase, partial [Saprospiraceae bacterium]